MKGKYLGYTFSILKIPHVFSNAKFIEFMTASPNTLVHGKKMVMENIEKYITQFQVGYMSLGA